VTFLVVEKPLFAANNKEGQDGCEEANNGDDNPSQAPIHRIPNATTK